MYNYSNVSQTSISLPILVR